MPPFPDITPPAMGTVFSPAVSPGASGDVNAKLRTLTQQNDDIKALLAAIYLSDTPQITGIVTVEGDLGTANDPASSPGGAGSVNAKLRLETAQLDQIAFLLTEIATGTTTTALPTPLAVSGTVTVLPGLVPWVVSLPDGNDVCEGATGDAAATVGGSGTLSAKLRLVTQQLEDIKLLLAETSGSSVSAIIPNPIGVSGLVAVSGALLVNQGAPGSEAWPVSVDAPLAVSGTMTVLQGTDPWNVVFPQPVAVSGNLTSTVSIPTPLEVSGTVFLGNSPTVFVQGPVGVSGTLSATVALPDPIGVSGTVTVLQGPDLWNVSFPQPIAVSGTLSTTVLLPVPLAVSGELNAHLPLPVGVSGTVTVLQGTDPWRVLFDQPIGVSGTLTTAVSIPTPLAVSGTVSIGNVPDVNAHLALPVGVSGTVSIGNSPTVFVQGPVGVSGTLSTTVVLPNPIGVSGTVTVLQGTDPWNVVFPQPIGVSGTLSASVVIPTPLGVSGELNAHLALPLGVSGTVTVLQGTDPWRVLFDQPIAVSGALTTTVAIPTPLGVSGTISIGNVPDVNAHLSLPIGVSGTLFANVIALPLPVGVSGTVSIGNVPTVLLQGPVGLSGELNVHLPLPLGVSGSVNATLALPLGISGTVSIGNVPEVNAHLPLPLGVSGTISIGNIPTVLIQGPVGVSGDLNAHLPLPVGVSGSVSVGNTVSVAVSGYGNAALTVLASAARTATTDSVDQSSYYHKRLLVVVDISAHTAAISLRPTLQIKDVLSGNYVTVWSAKANLAAQSTFVYYFADGAAGGAFTEVAAFGLPSRDWRFEMVHNNGNSVTYSVSAVGML